MQTLFLLESTPKFPTALNCVSKDLRHHRPFNEGYLSGRVHQENDSLLPEGKTIMSGRWVTSAPFHGSGHANSCFISGIFDTLVKFEDGGYGIVDFKTTTPAEHHAAFYGRQLHAYAFALENAALGKLQVEPVTHMGLLCFDPTSMTEETAANLSLTGPAIWVDIPVNMQGFERFLDEVLALLELPEPPEASSNCGFCVYRAESRNTLF